MLHQLVACSITARFDQTAARQFKAQQGFDLQENLDRLGGRNLGLYVKDSAALFAGIGSALPERRFSFAFPPGAAFLRSLHAERADGWCSKQPPYCSTIEQNSRYLFDCQTQKEGYAVFSNRSSIPHFGGYQYRMGMRFGLKRCLIRVRLVVPCASGNRTRAYLSISQKRFWTSIS